MTALTQLELPADGCDVWLAHQPAELPADLQRRWEGWLTEQERSRHRAFHFERHRAQYLLTRALVRSVLGRYLRTSPERLEFVSNAYGKPAVAGPFRERPIAFNLSNTDGLVVCAVTDGEAVGVDVEATDRPGETVSIAGSYFAARELHALLALPEAEQRARFFTYWTLKEAYIKARGLGLEIPLHQFAFLLQPGSERIDVWFDPALEDDAADWQFTRLDLGERHAGALAIRRGSRANRRIRFHVFDPRD